MHVTLDAQTEERIQREIDRGHYREPADVIARAFDLLDLLEAEQAWLEANRDAIEARLTEFLAQIERGEGLTPDRAREILAERRSSR